MAIKKVKFIENCFVDGELCARGETKSLEERDAEKLILLGRAIADDAKKTKPE